MKVLITGGAGFIGSHVAETCQFKSEVRVFDDFSSGKHANLKDVRCKIIEGSILDPSALETAVRGVDCIFHLAALVSVPLSCEKPLECVARNVAGTINVLQAAVQAKVKTFVFASSAAVYGDDAEVPKRESMPPRPRSPYAVTKLDGEYYCELLSSDTRMRTVALRFFNVFGPRQDPGGPYGAVVPLLIRQALQKKPITIFGDGEQTRDFIYVEDIASAIVFAAENTAMQGVFNAGYGKSVSINGLAQKILKLTGSASQVVHAPERPGDVRHSLAGTDRLLAQGWRPGKDFDLGLAKTVEYFRRIYV
jgi:UDP-glucose 4-epimerase